VENDHGEGEDQQDKPQTYDNMVLMLVILVILVMMMMMMMMESRWMLKTSG